MEIVYSNLQENIQFEDKPVLPYKMVKFIEHSDWDDFIKKIYNKPYSFQQQDGCKDRQVVDIIIPTYPEDYKDSTEGVSFKTWIERNPNELFPNQSRPWELELSWERDFYPHISMLINDLHSRGLLEEGEYKINIDW